MPFGDSITEGYVNEANTVEGGYRRKLYSLLTTAGYNVDFVGTLTDVNPTFPDGDHEGHGGFLIEEMLANAPSWLSEVQDPDVILLHVGTTNFWVGETLLQTQNHLRDLIAEFSTRRPFAKIVVASLIPRTDSFKNIQVSYNSSLPGIVAEQVALGRQVYFLDMYSALGSGDLADGVHPTLGGYDKMGDRWITGVTNVITPYGTVDPPAIAGVDAQTDLEHVTVKFSKPIRDEDAVTGNFSLSGGLSVVGVSLDAATKRMITLQTSTQSSDTVYTLTVNGVHDRTPAMHQIAPGSTQTFISIGPLANGGFELGDPADFGPLDRWTVTGNPMPVGFTSSVPGFVPVFSPSEGNRMAVFSNGSNQFNGSISQKFATIPGQAYVLSLDLGIVTNAGGRKQRLQIAVSGGTTLLSQQMEITSPGAFSYWVPNSYLFIADGTTTTLTLSDASASLPTAQTLNTDMLLDNVRVNEADALTVNSNLPSGVNVAVSPPDAGGNSNGVTGFTRHYSHGATVTLATPASSGAYLFVEWQEHGVTYAITSTITLTMDTGRSLTAVYTISTTPVALANAYATDENTVLVVPPPGVLANDSDPTPLPLTAVLDAAPVHGTLAMNSVGSFTYTPTAGFSGMDSFAYHATNGTSSSGIVTVSITVNPVGSFVNGGFELGDPVDFGTLDGWTVTGNPDNYPLGFTHTDPGFLPVFTPNEGDRMAVFSSGSNDFSGSISQKFATNPGQAYIIKLDMGVVAGTSGRKQRLWVGVEGGTILLSKQEEITSPGQFSFWDPKIYTFVADQAATTLILSDASSSLPSAQAKDTDLLLDNVRVEPAATLTVDSSLTSGVNVTVNPPDAGGNGNGVTGFSRYYNPGATVTLTTPATSGAFVFIEWQENGVTYATSLTTAVTMAANRTLTAIYALSAIPVALSDSYTIFKNTVLLVQEPGVLANDNDPNSLPLAAMLDNGPAHGSIALNANGGFTYTPGTDFSGMDSFTYHATNGTQSSGVVTVSIDINPVGPLVNGGFELGTPADFGTLDGWTVTGNPIPIGFTSTDPGFVPVFAPSEGNRMAVFNNGSNYFDGSISQTFSTIPGKEYVLALDLGIVAGTTGRKQRLDVAIDGQAPILWQREEITSPGTYSSWVPKSYTFIADSNTTTLTLSDASSSLPSAQAKDTDLLLDNVRVTEFIVPNTPPVAVNDGSSVAPFLTVAEDSGPSAPIAVLTNDSDIDFNPLTVTLANSQNGTVTITVDGSHLVFTPATNFNGAMTISYTISDGHGGTASATVFVTVTPVNDAPVATAQTAEVLEDGTLAITLAGSDLDGDALTYAVTTPPMHGVLAGTAPNLTYTPEANYHGSDGFAFTAHDSALASAPALVSITVTPVNDAPVAAAQTVEVIEDGTLAITLAGSDIDGDALSYTVTTPSMHGALAGTAPNLTYTPAADYHGSDGFAFTAHDSALASAPALVSITVTPVNDAPVATAQTAEVLEDGTLAITLAGSDIDGDALSYTVTTPPMHGALAGTAPNLTYTPEANYHGSDGFAFTAHDSALASASALVSITVTPVNDAPVATAQAVGVIEDGTLAITLAGSDIDGDALSYTVTTPPAHGALAGTAPNLTYTPAADYHGSDGFAFTAHDSALASAPALVSITVTPVNDAPVATAQAVGVIEDGTLAITLAGSDIDGDTLTYTVTTPPAHGALAGTAPNLTYTPAADYHGSDGFAFTAHDSALASAPALVSITVTPVNDAPVATAQAVEVLEDGTLAITLAGSDIDGDALSYTVTTPPMHGALAGTAPNLTYTPRGQLPRKRRFRLHGARQRAGLRAGPGFHHGHPGQRRAGGHRPGG